jgi:hypothetical protein
VASSCKGLNVWAHERVDAIGTRSLDEGIDAPFALLQIVLEGREWDIKSDVAAEAKAIGDGLRGRGERDLHAINGAHFHSVSPGCAAGAHNLKLGRRHFGKPGVSINERPHGMRCLCRHAMRLERAEKADDGVGNALAHIGQSPQLGNRGICAPVEATIRSRKEPLRRDAWQKTSRFAHQDCRV